MCCSKQRRLARCDPYYYYNNNNNQNYGTWGDNPSDPSYDPYYGRRNGCHYTYNNGYNYGGCRRPGPCASLITAIVSKIRKSREEKRQSAAAAAAVAIPSSSFPQGIQEQGRTNSFTREGRRNVGEEEQEEEEEKLSRPVSRRTEGPPSYETALKE